MSTPHIETFDISETSEKLAQIAAIRAAPGIRDNLALLTTAVKEATTQAKQSAESSATLAKTLNRITLLLVVVGVLQVLVTAIITLR